MINLAYPRTKTEFKDTVGVSLAICEHDGHRWASNNYWVTPYRRLAAWCEQAGYTECDTYDIVSGEARGGTPPVGQFLDLDDYTVPVELVQVAGRPALVQVDNPGKRSDEVLAVVLAGVDGVALNARYLRFLTHLDPIQERYGHRLSNVRLRQVDSISATTPSLRPVGVIVDVEARHGGHNGPDGRWVPETWSPAGERLIGVLMPVRLA